MDEEYLIDCFKKKLMYLNRKTKDYVLNWKKLKVGVLIFQLSQQSIHIIVRSAKLYFWSNWTFYFKITKDRVHKRQPSNRGMRAGRGAKSIVHLKYKVYRKKIKKWRGCFDQIVKLEGLHKLIFIKQMWFFPLLNFSVH